MSEKMNDQGIKENFDHIGKRMDDIATFVQHAANPLVKVKNGAEKEMLQADAIADLWNRGYLMQERMDDLYHRTQILADIQKTVQSYKEFRAESKALLAPVGRVFKTLGKIFLVLGGLTTTVYVIYALWMGEMSIKEFFQWLF